MSEASNSFRLEQRIAHLRDTVSRLNSQRYEQKPNLLGRINSTATGGSEIEKYLQVKFDGDLLGADFQSKNSTMKSLQLNEASELPHFSSRERPRNLKRSMSEREIDTLLSYKPTLPVYSVKLDSARSANLAKAEMKDQDRITIEQLEEKLERKDVIIKDLLKNLEDFDRQRSEGKRESSHKIADLESRLMQTEQMLQSAEMKTHHLQGQLEDLLVKQSTRERYIKSLEKEQNMTEQRLGEASHEQESLRQAISHFDSEKHRLLGENLEITKELKRKQIADEELGNMKKELDSYKLREKHFGEEALALHRDRLNYINDINALKAELNTVKSELDRALRAKRDLEVSSEQSFLVNRDELMDLRDTLKQKDLELKGLYSELASLRTPFKSTEHRYSSLERNSKSNASEVIDQLQSLLKVSRTEELLERVHQLLRQDSTSRNLQNFYNKVAALVRDCTEAEGSKASASKNFVWKWIKRVVEQYMLLKKANDAGIVEECMHLVGLRNSSDLPKYLRRMISENEALNYIGEVARRVTSRKSGKGEER